MTNSSQKMKLRATLVSILNKYNEKIEIDNTELRQDIDEIKKLEDKDYVSKTLLKEILNDNNLYINACAIMMIEAIDNKTFEKHAFDFLKNPEIPDDKKFFIISILKQKQIAFDYDEINNYIKHPEEIAQSGVKDFLCDAIRDPEVQLDLLDFYLNIPEDERLSLLNNLIEEFDGEDLANALSLIAQLDVEKIELEYVLNGLLKAKTPFALEGLYYILNNYSLEDKVKKIISKTIKEIEFANPKFINKEIIKNTKLLNTYMSFIDGQSNFSLTIARLKEDKTIDVCLLTINIMQGITSCMGFGGINKENYTSVMDRLFSDSIPIKIPSIASKALCKYYCDKNKKTKIKLPYEYIVWKALYNDIEDINLDVSDYINSKLETINLTDKKAFKLASSNLLSKWYYLESQNKHIDNLIEELEKNHITDLNKINELIEKTIEENYINDKTFRLELQSRLLIQAYAAYLADLKAMSACAYSMCFENPYIKMLISSIVDKSLYCYFAQKIEDMEDTEEKDENVFKNIKPTSYSISELQNLMVQLEAKWK